MAEHRLLGGAVVDPDRTAADFVPIEHQVVGIGPHGIGIRVQKFQLPGLRRRERVVHGVVAPGLLIPFEKREVQDPKGGKFARFAQPQAVGQFHPQHAQLGPDPLCLAR